LSKQTKCLNVFEKQALKFADRHNYGRMDGCIL